jgi:shikimate kinase
MKIFLTGLMGVGKTTIGKKLAACLQLPFIDLDRYIEQQKNMSVADLFAYFGENYFRQAEQACLQQIIQQESFVLACGGGTPCFYENMALMNANGVTIFLDASPAFIASRVKQSKTQRPLFKNATDMTRLTIVQTLFNKREQFYRKAKCTLNVEKLSAEEVAQQVVAFVIKK